jgi:hypothetical protein
LDGAITIKNAPPTRTENLLDRVRKDLISCGRYEAIAVALACDLDKGDDDKFVADILHQLNELSRGFWLKGGFGRQRPCQ